MPRTRTLSCPGPQVHMMLRSSLDPWRVYGLLGGQTRAGKAAFHFASLRCPWLLQALENAVAVVTRAFPTFTIPPYLAFVRPRPLSAALIAYFSRRKLARPAPSSNRANICKHGHLQGSDKYYAEPSFGCSETEEVRCRDVMSTYT